MISGYQRNMRRNWEDGVPQSKKKMPRRKVVHLALVTTYGVAGNEYSGIFQKIVTLEDLF